MWKAGILLISVTFFPFSCKETEKSKRAYDQATRSVRVHCIITTVMGEGSFANIDGGITDIATTSRADADRLGQAVSKIPERNTLYGRVCVRGTFTYKSGIIGHVQTKPRTFIEISDFQIISSDNNLDELRAITHGAPLPPKEEQF